MRSIPAAAALLSAALLSGGLRADDTPPTALHWVEDHWTAWNPPRDLAPGTPVHRVVPGDTLWDLAAANLGNPYLWPQIWEKNQYVLDAHWIYPGDPIVLGVEVEALDAGEIAGGRGSGSGGSGAAAAGGRGPGGGAAGTGAGGSAAGRGPNGGTTGRGPGGGAAGTAGAAGGAAGAAGAPGAAFEDDLGLGGELGADDPSDEFGGAGRVTLGEAGAGPGSEDGLESLDGLEIDTAGATASGPQPFGFESDLYCSGFIGEAEEALPISITGSEHQAYGSSLIGQAQRHAVRGQWGDMATTKYGLDVGDIVYLDAGRSEGLAPGDLLAAVRPEEMVRHPLRNETLGRFYSHLGRVRVLTVDAESAIGEVAHACDPIPVGTRMAPFHPEPVPLGRRTAPRPANDPTPESALESAPVIVRARDGVLSLGEDHLVFIDRGAEDDSTPGDVYTIYRLNREGFAPLPIGELAVLSVARRTSLARIFSSRLPIFIGDRLERK